MNPSYHKDILNKKERVTTMAQRKKILIINTGGTISCVRTSAGFDPKPGFVGSVLKTLPELSHPQMPDYQLQEYTPLIDSSNIQLEDWNRLATDIAANYDHFDGFVILHGTDTMAYTSSALSFMLENLAKPVIITGAQIPLSELRSDGKDNLITALYLAQSEDLSEVCVYFDQQLLRGNRAQKVSAYEFSAFDSPNFPALAKVGIQTQWRKHLLLAKPLASFSLQALAKRYIANFRIFPSFSTDVLKHLLTQPLKGLVLETYGSGNAQNNDPVFIDLLKQATQQGMVIVNCSQCHQGKVNMETYATGNSLKQAGVISGHNMTAEAAHCKLLYLLSKYKNVEKVKQIFTENLRGELD